LTCFQEIAQSIKTIHNETNVISSNLLPFLCGHVKINNKNSTNFSPFCFLKREIVIKGWPKFEPSSIVNKADTNDTCMWRWTVNCLSQHALTLYRRNLTKHLIAKRHGYNSTREETIFKAIQLLIERQHM
jgi:hypothetical protein